MQHPAFLPSSSHNAPLLTPLHPIPWVHPLTTPCPPPPSNFFFHLPKPLFYLFFNLSSYIPADPHLLPVHWQTSTSPILLCLGMLQNQECKWQEMLLCLLTCHICRSRSMNGSSGTRQMHWEEGDIYPHQETQKCSKFLQNF